MYCEPFYFSHVTLEEAFEETKRLDVIITSIIQVALKLANTAPVFKRTSRNS